MKFLIEIKQLMGYTFVYINTQIWVRDIPMNVTDTRLAQTFSKFGEISAIIMDRYQSVRQHKWIKHKRNELRQYQENRLHKTIQEMRNIVHNNVINDYQVMCLLSFDYYIYVLSNLDI